RRRVLPLPSGPDDRARDDHRDGSHGARIRRRRRAERAARARRDRRPDVWNDRHALFRAGGVCAAPPQHAYTGGRSMTARPDAPPPRRGRGALILVALLILAGIATAALGVMGRERALTDLTRETHEMAVATGAGAEPP